MDIRRACDQFMSLPQVYRVAIPPIGSDVFLKWSKNVKERICYPATARISVCQETMAPPLVTAGLYYSRRFIVTQLGIGPSSNQSQLLFAVPSIVGPSHRRKTHRIQTQKEAPIGSNEHLRCQKNFEAYELSLLLNINI